MNAAERNGAQRIETVIIGAGQAGLSTGYHLARCGRPFIILDSHDRVGDNWRHYWDSLRLYTPARVDGLPGMRFPAPRTSYPTKDEMADYLEAYANRFDLPVRTGVRVKRVHRDDVGGEFLVSTETVTYRCDNVVVASGTFGRTPTVPDFADSVAPDIVQLHSSGYQNPRQLQPGPVLVVGASHSGSDIAYEVAMAGHPTVLSGPIHGEAPFDINTKYRYLAFSMFLFLGRHLLTLRTPIGRKIRPEIRTHGGPLLRWKRADLARAGVEVVPQRTAGVSAAGRPTLGDGRVLDVANVVWCTGFHQDFSWLDMPVIGADGWPMEQRGVVPTSPGLYFVGLAFQYAFTSMLVGGAGRDAEHVANHLVNRVGKRRGGSKRMTVTTGPTERPSVTSTSTSTSDGH